MSDKTETLLESINERLLAVILLLANKDDAYDDDISNGFKELDASYDYVKRYIREQRRKLVERGFGRE